MADGFSFEKIVADTPVPADFPELTELEVKEVEEFLRVCVQAAYNYLAMHDKKLARLRMLDAFFWMCEARDRMDEEIRIERTWSTPRHKRGGIRLDT